ncbi:MAG: hypothetical protein ACK2T0_00620 [Anaerolineales bacterium]
MKIPLLITAAVVLTLGAACGTPATPTVDPAQIQASAVAAASTMVAKTEQAAPTATVEPPTPLPSPTELPSPTPAELPTLEFQVPTIQAAPTTASSSGTSAADCNAPMALDPAGPRVTAVISNTTNGDLVLSFYLEKNEFGECGYRGFNLGPHDTITASDLPPGCYFAGAFVQDPKKPSKSFGNFCLTNGDHFNVEVGPDVILLK